MGPKVIVGSWLSMGYDIYLTLPGASKGLTCHSSASSTRIVPLGRPMTRSAIVVCMTDIRLDKTVTMDIYIYIYRYIYIYIYIYAQAYKIDRGTMKTSKY